MKNRLVILTIGHIHSGKTSFARKFIEKVPNTIHIERDIVASFVSERFPTIKQHQLAKFNKNFPLREEIYEKIEDSAIKTPKNHLFYAQCHTFSAYRAQRIQKFRKMGQNWKILGIYFDISPEILEKRVKSSKKSQNVLTFSKNFVENLEKQKKMFQKPTKSEISTFDHFFTIKNNENEAEILEKIIKIVKNNEK